MLYIWWDQLRVVYYELLKPNETITGALYRTQLMRLSRALKEKRAHYYRHDKIILLHDNARPHVAAPVKTYLEHLNGKFYSARRILQTLLLPTTICSDDTCLSSTSNHMNTKNCIDDWIALKDEAFFRRFHMLESIFSSWGCRRISTSHLQSQSDAKKPFLCCL